MYLRARTVHPTEDLPAGDEPLNHAASPEIQRQRIKSAIIHTLLATPAGPRLARDKLESYIDSHFDQLVEGGHLEFTPLYRGLLRVPGVTERDIFVGVLNLRDRLAGLGLTMSTPSFQISRNEQRNLLEEAQRSARAAPQSSGPADRVPLGELLVAENLVRRSELDEALQMQRQLGGRVGSHLVRLGYISEAELTQFLERQLDVPSVQELSDVDADALAHVSRATARALNVVPIEMSEGKLRLAMVDPSDVQAIRRVQFEAGCAVEPVAAPELVVQYALARYYGVSTTSKVSDGVFRRAAIAEAPPTPDLETTDLSAAMREPMVHDQSDLARRMLDAQDENEVIDNLVAFAMARGGGFAVFTIDGQDAVPHAVPNASLPINDSPVMRAAVSARRVQRGRLVEDAATTALAHALGPWTQSTVRAIPLVVHDRVRGILVCEPRDDRATTDGLRELAEAALEAVLARQVLERYAEAA